MRAWLVLAGLMLAVLSIPSYATSGDPWTAHYMWRRYYNTTAPCDKADDKAAYLCTGIIFRGTRPGEAKHVWWPEDKSISTSSVSHGGVSFSYMRSDIPTPSGAYWYPNGYTLYPQLGKYAAPASKIKLDVLCAYPMDGSTDSRANAGCGTRPDFAISSKACDEQGIKTAAQWMNKYPTPNKAIICGFNMKSQTKAAFEPVLEIMRTRGKESGPGMPSYDELRIKTWPANDATSKVFPIESFFYAAGNATGLKNARGDQADFYHSTGQFVPIIKITFPTTRSGKFDFTYEPADQNVPVPAQPAKDPLPCDKDGFDKVC